MNDVARAAGVGLKTVSRVVNGEGDVSAQMIERVRAAIAALGYRHNAGASSLRRTNQSTATIGLVLEDVSNPFSSLLHRAIEDIAREHHFVVLAGSSDENPQRESELVDTFVSRRVDGLLLVPTGNEHRYLVDERASGMSIVLVDRPSSGLPDVDTVLCDNYEGARGGTEHMLAHGHTRVAHLGDDPVIATAGERFRGYRDALRARRLPFDKRLVRRSVGTVDAAANATHELLALPDPPTAIFSAQNIITIGAVRALRERGEHHRIAVVGFDDFVLADLLDPPVTVVHQDAIELGRQAAQLLFRRIRGGSGAPEHVVIGTRLIVRGSGEIPPPA